MDMITLATVPAILLALNEGLKRLGMPSKWAIVVNWFGGMFLSVALTYPEVSVVQDILLGFVYGSIASGIYQDVKKLQE